MIQLDVSKIKNHPGQVTHLNDSFELESIEGPDIQLSFPLPVRLKGTLTNEAGYLRFNGSLQGKVRIACGRCLEPFEYPLDLEMDEVFYSKIHEQQEISEDWTPFQGDTLDISPTALKSIVSELPMKVLCRDDCKGLCQKCGANRNKENCDCSSDDIDPRLEVLKKFLDQ